MSEDKKSLPDVGASGQALKTTVGAGKHRGDFLSKDSMTKAKMQVSNYLRYGAANAISTTELMKLTGASSARQLQGWIAVERRAGVPILSSTQGGYFLPASGDAGRAEATQFYHSLRSRAIRTLEAAKVARQLIDILSGQISVEDGGGGDGEIPASKKLPNSSLAFGKK